MGYPTRLLAEGEQLVLDLHPHWKALVRPILVLLLVLAGVGFGTAAMPDGDYHGWGQLAVLVVGLVLLAAYALAPFLRWVTTRYVVTDRRVLVRTGVLARTGRDVPLTRVNDITFSHSLLERMLGCGTLVVESAGERGQVVLDDVPHVEDVQRRLYELVEDVDQRRFTADAAGPDD